MSLYKTTKNPFPQMPCASTEFVLVQLFKSVRIRSKIDAPSETPDP